MNNNLLSEGTEVHVTFDIMGNYVDEDGEITMVNPFSDYPYGVSTDSGIYVRAAANCVTVND